METENPNGRPCPADQDTSTTPQEQAPVSPPKDSDAALLERFSARLDHDRAEATRIVEEGPSLHNHIRVAEAQRTLSRLAFVTPETELIRYRAAEVKAREEEEKRKDNEARVIQEGKQSSWKAFVDQRGERYAECAIRNYEISCPAQEAVVAAVRDYCRNIKQRIAEGTNVLLLGPAGTGKDHLATAVARAAVNECGGAKDTYCGFRGEVHPGFDIQWSNGPALFGEVRDTFDTKGAKEKRIIDRLVRADVLYLSDLLPPGNKLTDFQASIAYQVVDDRYNRGKPTWLTLNVASRAEMEAGLGSAIVDRLIDGAVILQCAWPSYRTRLVKP